MTEPIPDILKEVHIVRLQPGDVLAVVTEKPLSMADVDEIQQQLAELWPHNKCVVIHEAELQVIRSTTNNTITGTVHGTTVQAGDINGPLNL